MLVAKTPEHVHCPIQCLARFKFFCSSYIRLYGLIYIQSIKFLRSCFCSSHTSPQRRRRMESLTTPCQQSLPPTFSTLRVGRIVLSGQCAHYCRMCNKPKRTLEWERGFKHLSDVQRFRSKYIASWGSQAIPVDRIWCDTLFMRSVVALRSVAILIHHDSVDDAAIIVRTLFEIEFQLVAIKSDRQIAVRLIQGAELARLKRLKKFRESDRP